MNESLIYGSGSQLWVGVIERWEVQWIHEWAAQVAGQRMQGVRLTLKNGNRAEFDGFCDLEYSRLMEWKGVWCNSELVGVGQHMSCVMGCKTFGVKENSPKLHFLTMYHYFCVTFHIVYTPSGCHSALQHTYCVTHHTSSITTAKHDSRLNETHWGIEDAFPAR